MSLRYVFRVKNKRGYITEYAIRRCFDWLCMRSLLSHPDVFFFFSVLFINQFLKGYLQYIDIAHRLLVNCY